jgi:hypothetical protein
MLTTASLGGDLPRLTLTPVQGVAPLKNWQRHPLKPDIEKPKSEADAPPLRVEDAMIAASGTKASTASTF